MSERQWHYVHQRTREGPVPESVLRTRFQHAELPLDVLVWSETMEDWVIAHDEPAFQNIRVQHRSAPRGAPSSVPLPPPAPEPPHPARSPAGPAKTSAAPGPQRTASPPPLQPASRIQQIYVYRPSGNAGPYSRDEIAQMFAAGSIRSTDMVWREGLSAWTPVSTFLGVVHPPAARQPQSQSHSSASQTQAQPLPQNVTPNQPGGIGRLLYFVALIGSIIVLGNFSFGSYPYVIVSLFLTCLTFLRLENMGYNRLWSILSVIPILNCLVILPCAVVPPGYAKHQQIDLAAKVIVALIGVVFVFVVVVIVAANS